MVIRLAAVLLVSASPVLAGENWRYCVAQDESGHAVYLTDAFQSAEGIDALEHRFNLWLDESELRHSWGICPLAVSAFGPADDIMAAANYNKGLGLRAIRVAWHPH